MEIGKIIVTTACSLLLSGATFAGIVPTPVDNSVFELSVMTEKISTVGEDYGKASSMLSSFYDRSIGQANMEGQTPVYAGGDYTSARNQNTKAICNTPGQTIRKLAMTVPPLTGGNKQSDKKNYPLGILGIVLTGAMLLMKKKGLDLPSKNNSYDVSSGNQANTVHGISPGETSSSQDSQNHEPIQVDQTFPIDSGSSSNTVDVSTTTDPCQTSQGCITQGNTNNNSSQGSINSPNTNLCNEIENNITGTNPCKN